MDAGNGTLEGTEKKFIIHDAVEACPPEAHFAVEQGTNVGHFCYQIILVLAEGSCRGEDGFVFFFFGHGSERVVGWGEGVAAFEVASGEAFL